METFPNNSQRPEGQREPKRIERVTSGPAVRRKASLGNRFSRTFIGGDARTAVQYVVTSVVIPTVKETLAEAGSTLIERIIYGDSRPKRGSSSPMAGPLGYVSYNRLAQSGPQRATTGPALSQRARARHDFGELIIESRSEAEEVVERMYDLLERYDVVTVADLYELTGLRAGHTDHKWGWDRLSGTKVGRVRGGGYVLELPEPRSLE